MKTRTLNVFCAFAGAGGGALGCVRMPPVEVAGVQWRWRSIGAVDSDPVCVESYRRLVGEAQRMDLFSREQYEAFHGEPPPAGWREATPADVRAAAGGLTPDLVISSPPCKASSALLPHAKSQSARYRSLNAVALRGIELMLQAWQDDPVAVYQVENVTGMSSRANDVFESICALFRRYGYVVVAYPHDLGAIGGLGATRKRLLIMARHPAKLPECVFEPRARGLRTIGDVLGALPPQGHPDLGPMHRPARLTFATAVRLALVPAGRDWRALEELNVEGGVLRDYVLVPEMFSGTMGVRGWSDVSYTVKSRSSATCGAYSVADPRRGPHASSYAQLGVRHWSDTGSTVTAQSAPGGGAYSVADPRLDCAARSHAYRVAAWESHASCVTSSWHVSGGGGLQDRRGAALALCDDAGRPAAAATLPAPDERGLWRIRSLDGTFHNPFTTLELAALQGFVDPEVDLPYARWFSERALAGRSQEAWRSQIGQAIPPPAQTMIAQTLARAFGLAASGSVFELSTERAWFGERLLAAGLSTPHDLQMHPA